MSIRRTPGEVVRRKAGSGFVGSSEPEFIKIPAGEEYAQAEGCFLCQDPKCNEYGNLEVCDENGKGTGEYIYHISECEMEDV